MKHITQLKPSIAKIASEMSKTYSDALNHINGNVTFRALPDSDIKEYLNLAAYKYNETDLDIYVDNLLKGHFSMMEARKSVEDNYIPQLNINLGIGDYAAFVAGDVYFKKDTSWSLPIITDLKMYKDLPPIGTSKWYRKYMYILERVLSKTKDTDIPFARGFFSPLDLAEALHGSEIYTDFYDNPDKLHELLDYCADVTIKFAEDIYGLIRKYRKNPTYGTMFIDGIINMSEDIASMISPDLYDEFCAPHTQKIISHFGSGHMHSHSCAIYLVKHICDLKNVTNLWLATDPNHPRPFDMLDQLIEDANGTCLAIDCNSFEEIESNIDILKKGNFSVCLPVRTIEEAISYTEKFRSL
ncbi:MAG TPA: uroporphyrinogen decarboxylase family protein [Clostridia bacterium]|jgi:hypothetical protein|nr:hypothetical protein [Clostridiaceae bacterium]HPJ75472.1 uroporphyrinogen decarboxylase family protein [Clostridia bacterium]HXK72950.1 uroporphyrinogen decarboxylase family protein [Clostridia bacterium]